MFRWGHCSLRFNKANAAATFLSSRWKRRVLNVVRVREKTGSDTRKPEGCGVRTLIAVPNRCTSVPIRTDSAAEKQRRGQASWEMRDIRQGPGNVMNTCKESGVSQGIKSMFASDVPRQTIFRIVIIPCRRRLVTVHDNAGHHEEKQAAVDRQPSLNQRGRSLDLDRLYLKIVFCHPISCL